MNSRIKFVLASPFLCLCAFAANFSKNLNQEDIESTNRKLASTLQHRAWTNSESAPRKITFNIGVESGVGFNTSVNNYGDKSGRVPSVLPIPKLYAAVSFQPDIHVSASLFPGANLAGITTFGFATEWFFLRDPRLVSYSMLLHYSHSQLFKEYRANTQGARFSANHDFKDFTLYGGAGFISVESRVNETLLAAGTDDKFYGSFHPHFIVGAKIDWDYPISIQAELIRQEISLGLLVAKTF